MKFITFSVLFILAFSARAQEEDISDASVEPILTSKKSQAASAKEAGFSKGLFFDQIENGVVLSPIELEYDLSKDGGRVLNIGNVLFAEKNFFFTLVPLGQAHPELSQILTPEEAQRNTLVMRWPEPLFTSGLIEMISKTGVVLWKAEITPEMRASWSKKLAGWYELLKQRGMKNLKRSGLFSTQYAEESLGDRNIPFKNQKEIFRFCLSQTQGRAQSRLCSRWYGTKTSGKKIALGKARVDAITPRVLLQGEKAPLADDKVVPMDSPTSFYAELLGGESYEFVAQPLKLNLMDISDTVKPNILRIVGTDTRPTTPSVLLNPDEYNSVTKLLNFEATIGDNRKFWLANLKRDHPIIYLPGQGGGVFKQKLDLTEIPRSSARPYLDDRTPRQTYTNDFKIFGRKLPEVQLTTDQNSIVTQSADGKDFLWYFKAEDRGEINRSYLNVQYEGKTYRSYYEAYKGYPRELSIRFTGFSNGEQNTLLGEVAYNHWFETLFGWTDYRFGRHRWGLSVRAFQSFSSLKVDTAGNTAKLAVNNADLKYRLTPGLWGRDETLGVSLSYQSVSFEPIKAPMIGGGVFWARSMPRGFDDFLNAYIPFMNKPKWVDMELIYYSTSLDSKVELHSNFALNFHGKVLWTPNIFGEAGFGLKGFSFADQEIQKKATLGALYGTIGLGVSF